MWSLPNSIQIVFMSRNQRVLLPREKIWNFTKIAGEINPPDLTPERRNVLELTTKVWKNTFEAH